MATWAQKSKANRERFNAQWRNWYRANRERKMAWQKRRLDEMRAWFRELKATKSCEDCGEATPECLHFHHKDPRKKTLEVSVAVMRWSRERVLAEIAKCRVLCANCHLKLHWEQRQARKGSRGERI